MILWILCLALIVAAGSSLPIVWIAAMLLTVRVGAMNGHRHEAGRASRSRSPARRERSVMRMDVPGDADQSPIGMIGQVTVSIPSGGLGEVLLPLRGGTEAFAAWADQPIARRTRVLVVECPSARSVIVVPLPVD
ncbi:hypothetical protein [Streptacidiphilus sp. EB129]|uniref:hypothetical protein n=1 Tax=Streptacidiphilus sp. EB129 TaxID=3156262 RepID=UPI003513FBC7